MLTTRLYPRPTPPFLSFVFGSLCPLGTMAPFYHLRSCSVFHARPPYENSTHAPTMRSTSVLTFLPRKYAVFPLLPTSIQALFDGSLAPYIPDRTCLVRVPRGIVGSRVAITCKCLVTVPASFFLGNFSLRPSGNPFRFRQTISFFATHRTMQYYIRPWFPIHASKGLDLGVTDPIFRPRRTLNVFQ